MVKDRVLKRINAINAKHDGHLTLDEFTTLFREEAHKQETIDKAISKFKELDVESSGFLENAELVVVIDWMLSMDKSNPDKEALRSTMLKRIEAAHSDGVPIRSVDDFASLYEDEMHIVELIKKGRFKFLVMDPEDAGLEEPEIETVLDFMMKSQLSSAETKSTTKEQILVLLRERLPVEGHKRMKQNDFISLFEEVIGNIAIGDSV
jgi:Ca2+-binding EF-hand superfamily protein